MKPRRKKKPAKAAKPAAKPPADRSKTAAYDKFRKQQAAISRARSESGRDIAPLPAVKDPARRARAKTDLEFHLRTYLPQTFDLPWSEDHRRIIRKMEIAATVGGQMAFAMPRGSGKTAITRGATEWAMLHGHRRFITLIGAEEGSARQLLDDIRTDFECNQLLFDDFPEVCHPVRKLEGIAHRANAQTCNGKRTHLEWTGDQIVLPSIEIKGKPTPASAGIIRCAGITGRIRGMTFTRPDGKTVRPDFVIIDDPQTDESSRSPAQTQQRINTISGAILGLAGAGRKIAAVMPCTVIHPDDLADQLLDREKFPQWQGERTKMIYAFPNNAQLWEQYAEIRANSLRAGNGGREATEFYRANREAMDEGARVAWPVRHNDDEISAVQNAMNLKIDNPEAFAAEQQNEPIRPDQHAGNITTAAIGLKLNNRQRGVVPEGCEHITAFADVQGKMLYWMVCAWQRNFTGAIIDYGSYPDQKRSFYTLADSRRTLQMAHPGGQEAAIYAGLMAISDQLAAREWHRADGAIMKLERMPIDAGYETKAVELFIRQSKNAAILIPSFGKYIGAATSPMALWPGNNRTRRNGWHWITDLSKSRLRHLLIDTNHWKSFAAKALLTPMASAGCLSIFGSEPREHDLLALHFTSEYRQAVSSRGRTVDEWKLKPGNPDNHWWDCLVGNFVAASMVGCTSHGAADQERTRERRRVKLSDLQKKARHWKSGS